VREVSDSLHLRRFCLVPLREQAPRSRRWGSFPAGRGRRRWPSFPGRWSRRPSGNGLRRSRPKGGEGERTWTGWGVFAYNVETYGVYAW